MQVIEKLQAIRATIEEWDGKTGHERCWYYPDIFKKIALILDIKLNDRPGLPPEIEFKTGCDKYRKEQYNQVDNDFYEDERFCDNCNRYTQHKCRDTGHERDSSQDYQKCLTCEWYSIGWGDYHSPY